MYSMLFLVDKTESFKNEKGGPLGVYLLSIASLLQLGFCVLNLKIMNLFYLMKISKENSNNGFQITQGFFSCQTK